MQSKIAVAGATGRVGSHVASLLWEFGHEVVPIARSLGVDLVTGDGLAEALEGVDAIVDAATGSSPDAAEATAYFEAAPRNLQAAGERAGVQRIVVVSIVGADHFAGGYGVAKVAHEQAMLAGPVPARIVRATQFHEFVAQMVAWGTQGEVAYVPPLQTQLVAARSVAEVLVDVVTAPDADGPILEVGGPRAERLADVARLLVGGALRVEEVADPSDPNSSAYADRALLPGPDAILTGPTFEEWLAVARKEVATL
jgi:uncharacterized protein YbjT (DUF2867 family)